MDQLITLIIYIIVFAIVAYGMHWICVQFGLPRPVFWVCGALLLIVLLLFLTGRIGSLNLPRLR